MGAPSEPSADCESGAEGGQGRTLEKKPRSPRSAVMCRLPALAVTVCIVCACMRAACQSMPVCLFGKQQTDKCIPRPCRRRRAGGSDRAAMPSAVPVVIPKRSATSAAFHSTLGGNQRTRRAVSRRVGGLTDASVRWNATVGCTRATSSTRRRTLCTCSPGASSCWPRGKTPVKGWAR